ncbi:hypothetical protein MMARE11_38250 [Mycobacterium marinum E11]|nr:hypothetical protein MMARE11_38250 [Mycobacterium marinum E11]
MSIAKPTIPRLDRHRLRRSGRLVTSGTAHCATAPALYRVHPRAAGYQSAYDRHYSNKGKAARSSAETLPPGITA